MGKEAIVESYEKKIYNLEYKVTHLACRVKDLKELLKQASCIIEAVSKSHSLIKELKIEINRRE